jgi:Tol biopolymer transport system component
MAKTRYRNNPFVLFILLLVFLSACGTLEVGIERTAAPGGVAGPTATALAAENADLATQLATPATETTDVPPTPMPTPTPILAVTELRVAFVKATEHGNNVWLWKEGKAEAVPLTKDGGVGNVKISDDGEIVAFTRGDGLWMVRVGGADEESLEERQLISAEDFAAMEARDPELAVALYRFEWIPGSHILAFNTQLRMEIGLVLNDDLHLVNADTLERTDLFPPGEGGEFTYSPDGRQVAIMTAGSISLVDADGGNRREVLTYTPVATHSEARYYARPVWAADSSALRVVIPPVDPFTQPSADASVWHINTDGRPAILLRHIPMTQMSWPAFSSDLRYIAHLYMEPSGQAPGSELLITDLELDATITYFPRTGGDAGATSPDDETIVYNPMAGEFYGWAPGPTHTDGERYFAFRAQTEPELSFQAQIGQLGGDLVPAYTDAEVVIDVRWVDADRYLFLAQGGRGWAILLGQIGGPVTSVAGVVGSVPAYDFAAPPIGAPWSDGTPAATPATGDPGESPIPSGLIYQNAEGLWHVNADGESVRLFDRPGSVLSSDAAQVLYVDADDVWLADVSTGERRNLTQTPDRMECCAQWWSGRPGVVLISSRTPEQEGPNFGLLTMVRLDGSDYRVLDDSQASYARPAPSPDGQTVAYDLAGQPWLYQRDTGPEPFDLTLYGMAGDPQLRVVNPAWSPDGQRLAWVIGDCRRGECTYSIGVFDMEGRIVRLHHPYTPVGMGGQPPAPAWSPDGHWLAFTAWAVDPGDGGLWVVRADGQEEEHHLESDSRAYYDPIWSPDGRWLAFSSVTQGTAQGLRLAEVETWTLHAPDLPPDAYPVDWVSVRP